MQYYIANEYSMQECLVITNAETMHSFSDLCKFMQFLKKIKTDKDVYMKCCRANFFLDNYLQRGEEERYRKLLFSEPLHATISYKKNVPNKEIFRLQNMDSLIQSIAIAWMLYEHLVFFMANDLEWKDFLEYEQRFEAFDNLNTYKKYGLTDRFYKGHDGDELVAYVQDMKKAQAILLELGIEKRDSRYIQY